MAQLVTAVFRSRVVAEAALMHLVESGVSRDSVSMYAGEAEPDADGWPEAVRLGALIGGTVGALAAGMMTIGSMAVPAAGFVAAGPLVAALAGAGVGGTSGGLLGAALSALPGRDATPRFARPVHIGVWVADREASRVADMLRLVGAKRAHAVRPQVAPGLIRIGRGY